MRLPLLRLRFLLLCLFSCSALAAASAQSPELVRRSARVLTPVDSSQTTPLANHVPLYARAGGVPSDAADPSATIGQMTLMLSRAPEVQAAFEQLLADQQNPNSPRFHQWLQPAEVGDLYGPAPADVEAATAWLQSQGFTIRGVSPNKLFIDFTGTVDQASRAFGTSFRVFHLANGESRYSLTQEPSVPAALAPVVSNIVGLSAIRHYSHAHKGELIAVPSGTAHPNLNASSGAHYLVAGDFATQYDLNSLYTAGTDGTGQHIAIAGVSRIDAIDVTRLQAIQGQASKQPNTIIPPSGADPGTAGTTSGKDNGGQDEATLDVDRTLSTAPGATIDLVVSGDIGAGNTFGTDGLWIAINHAISTLNDPILSISFGGCEALNGSSTVSYENSYFQTAASQGISVFISSGDSGAAGCNAFYSTIPTSQTLSINDMCAGPYVTCVGGTEFVDTVNPSLYWSSTNSSSNNSSLLQYVPEGVWNEVSVDKTGAYSYGASGGGISVYMSRPTWQTGTGVPSGNFRLVPDIALTSSTYDGFVTCLNYLGATCGSFYSFGGTSAAAPSMAAIQALANQSLKGVRQGVINPTLYGLAASTSKGVFHDVTVASSGVANCSASAESLCNNSTPAQTSASGLAGYTVNPGFDLATGWGSVDGAKYVAAIQSSSTLVSTTTAVTASPNPVLEGVATTLTAKVTFSNSTATPTGTVQFYSNGTAIGAAQTLGSNGTASLNYTFTSPASYSVTAVYSGDTTFSTSTSAAYTVNVTAATFSLAATSASSLSLVGGATTGNTLALTLTSTNGFAGAVNLTCAASSTTGTLTATNTTCAVSPASVTLAANGTAQATVTVSTTAGTSGTATYTITGTGTTSGATVGSTATAAITATVTSPGVTLAAAPSQLSLTGNATTGNTVTATVTATNGFFGSVALSCTSSAPSVATCSSGAAVLTANGTGTIPVTVVPVLHASGTATLTLSATGTMPGSTVAYNSTSQTVTVQVVQVGGTLAVVANPNKVVAGNTTTLTATFTPASNNGTPTGNVTFLVNGTSVGTGAIGTNGGVSSATLNYTPVSGSSTPLSVTATFSDSGYSLTTAAATSLTVETFTASAGGLTFTSGATSGNASTLTLSSVNGYAGTVALNCLMSTSTAAYPPTCTVSPNSVTLAANGTVTASVTIASTTATQAQHGGLQAGFAGGWRPAALLVLLSLALLPFRRRNAVRGLMMLALMAAGMSALSGCGNGGTVTTPTPVKSSAGNYVVTVTGTGTSTGQANPLSVTTTFTVAIQ